MVLRGALTGCGDTRFIVYEGWVSGYLVFLPLAYLFAMNLGYGILGGYVGFILWCMTDCVALALRFYFKRSGKKGG
jgi:Na+-driven multidrug efflux pump